MELNHLKYFYEVARAGSFTRASKVLRVSQPSISKMIKHLEEQHDVKLFDRGRRQVTLTQTGRRFFESCEQIFREVDGLAGFLANSREECSGELLIGASDNLCNHVLPKILIAFGKAHPKVTTKLFAGTSEDIKANLLAGRADLGVFYTPATEPAFEQERLAFIPFVLVTARPATFEELKQLPCVGSRVVDYSRPYPALRMLQSVGLRPTTFFETNNQETQKRMVLEGYGYTLVPRHMVLAEVASRKLHIVKAPKRIGAHIILCRKRGRSLPKPALLFQEVLRATLREGRE